MAGLGGDGSCCVHSREEAERDECSAPPSPFYLVLDPNPAEGIVHIYSRSFHLNELTAGTSSEICPGIHFHADSKFFHIGNLTGPVYSRNSFILHNNAMRTTQRGTLRPRAQNEILEKTLSRNGDKRKRWAKSECV